MKPETPKIPYFIDSLARGLVVLGLFSRENPALTMMEIVNQTGLNKATAFRILSTLEATGYLERDDDTKRYRPALKVLTLGFTAINNLNIRQIARPHLEKLAQELDLTASLSVLDNLWVVYVDRIRNREIVGVLLGLGDRIPAHCSSMGKAILAQLDPGDLENRLDGIELQPSTHLSIRTIEDFKDELKRVRQQGYALNDGELFSGLRAVAAPIFNNQNQVVAAVNVSGSADAISSDRLNGILSTRIMDTAEKISVSLSNVEL